MKKWLIAGAGVLLLGIAVCVAVFFGMVNLGKIIKYAVNTYGPAITRTDVRLGDAAIRLFAAQGTLKDLYIGNPAGFTASKLFSADTLLVRLDRRSIRGNPVIIDRIEINSPDITYEKAGGTDNFKALLRNIDEFTAGLQSGAKDNASAQKKSGGGQGTRLILRDLVISNAHVTTIISSRGAKSISATLPDLHLTNIGGSNGASPAEVARQVVAALYDSILSSTGLLNKILGTAGSSTKSLGTEVKKGAEKVTDGIQKLFGK